MFDLSLTALRMQGVIRGKQNGQTLGFVGKFELPVQSTAICAAVTSCKLNCKQSIPAGSV
jgi:hypothetical protein